MRPLGIEGAWVLEPKVFPDDRGSFHEWFRGNEFRAATGQDLNLAQANCSLADSPSRVTGPFVTSGRGPRSSLRGAGRVPTIRCPHDPAGGCLL